MYFLYLWDTSFHFSFVYEWKISSHVENGFFPRRHGNAGLRRFYVHNLIFIPQRNRDVVNGNQVGTESKIRANIAYYFIWQFYTIHYRLGIHQYWYWCFPHTRTCKKRPSTLFLTISHNCPLTINKMKTKNVPYLQLKQVPVCLSVLLLVLMSTQKYLLIW